MRAARNPEKSVSATFSSIFQIIPAASFVKITKSPETVMVSGLLTMVRGTGLELTRYHINPCRLISKSAEDKATVKAVRVRQR